MTQNDIYQMALQAGLGSIHVIEPFEAFAKLVAAKEREICARIADQSIWAAQVSKAIRARGEK